MTPAEILAQGRLAQMGSEIFQLLVRGWEKLLGPEGPRLVPGGLTGAEGLTLLTVVLAVGILNRLIRAGLPRWARRQEDRGLGRRWVARLLRAGSPPVRLLLWLGGLYLVMAGLAGRTEIGWVASAWTRWIASWVAVGVLIGVGWLLLRVTREAELGLQEQARRSVLGWDDLLWGILGRGLRVLVPVLGLFWVTPLLGVPETLLEWFRTGGSLVLVGAFGWFLIQSVQVGQQALLSRFDISTADNLQARKVHTQVKVIARVLYVMIGVFTVASALMLFEEVRRLGTSLLASAGILGIVAGFAAQRTVANLFAGFQLALTQPVRLDDVVIVEGEWGRIEEITLTYVVIRIWDDRRLIVPLSYFIERPFQNWTRTTAEILGSVILWVDYTVPVDEVRRAVGEIVAKCPDWDRRFWNLQVTDTTDRAVQLRVLATAADASRAWNLRCEIREQLLAHLRIHYPDSLPRLRAELVPPPARGSSVSCPPPA